MTCRGKGSQTELAGCTWNGKEAEQRINTDLTESSKSPASIAQSNKQWVGSGLHQEWCKPLLISCEAAFDYEQVAKRIANSRLTACGL